MTSGVPNSTPNQRFPLSPCSSSPSTNMASSLVAEREKEKREKDYTDARDVLDKIDDKQLVDFMLHSAEEVLLAHTRRYTSSNSTQRPLDTITKMFNNTSLFRQDPNAGRHFENGNVHIPVYLKPYKVLEENEFLKNKAAILAAFTWIKRGSPLWILSLNRQENGIKEEIKTCMASMITYGFHGTGGWKVDAMDAHFESSEEGSEEGKAEMQGGECGFSMGDAVYFVPCNDKTQPSIHFPNEYQPDYTFSYAGTDEDGNRIILLVLVLGTEFKTETGRNVTCNKLPLFGLHGYGYSTSQTLFNASDGRFMGHSSFISAARSSCVITVARILCTPIKTRILCPTFCPTIENWVKHYGDAEGRLECPLGQTFDTLRLLDDMIPTVQELMSAAVNNQDWKKINPLYWGHYESTLSHHYALPRVVGPSIIEIRSYLARIQYILDQTKEHEVGVVAKRVLDFMDSKEYKDFLDVATEISKSLERAKPEWYDAVEKVQLRLLPSIASMFQANRFHVFQSDICAGVTDIIFQGMRKESEWVPTKLHDYLSAKKTSYLMHYQSQQPGNGAGKHQLDNLWSEALRMLAPYVNGEPAQIWHMRACIGSGKVMDKSIEEAQAYLNTTVNLLARHISSLDSSGESELISASRQTLVTGYITELKFLSRKQRCHDLDAEKYGNRRLYRITNLVILIIEFFYSAAKIDNPRESFIGDFMEKIQEDAELLDWLHYCFGCMFNHKYKFGDVAIKMVMAAAKQKRKRDDDDNKGNATAPKKLKTSKKGAAAAKPKTNEQDDKNGISSSRVLTYQVVPVADVTEENPKSQSGFGTEACHRFMTWCTERAIPLFAAVTDDTFAKLMNMLLLRMPKFTTGNEMSRQSVLPFIYLYPGDCINFFPTVSSLIVDPANCESKIMKDQGTWFQQLLRLTIRRLTEEDEKKRGENAFSMDSLKQDEVKHMMWLARLICKSYPAFDGPLREAMTIEVRAYLVKCVRLFIYQEDKIGTINQDAYEVMVDDDLDNPLNSRKNCMHPKAHIPHLMWIADFLLETINSGVGDMGNTPADFKTIISDLINYISISLHSVVPDQYWPLCHYDHGKFPQRALSMFDVPSLDLVAPHCYNMKSSTLHPDYVDIVKPTYSNWDLLVRWLKTVYKLFKNESCDSFLPARREEPGEVCHRTNFCIKLLKLMDDVMHEANNADFFSPFQLLLDEIVRLNTDANGNVNVNRECDELSLCFWNILEEVDEVTRTACGKKRRQAISGLYGDKVHSVHWRNWLVEPVQYAAKNTTCEDIWAWMTVEQIWKFWKHSPYVVVNQTDKQADRAVAYMLKQSTMKYSEKIHIFHGKQFDPPSEDDIDQSVSEIASAAVPEANVPVQGNIVIEVTQRLIDIVQPLDEKKTKKPTKTPKQKTKKKK